jgi:curved DNA-binding protein CbpA
MTTKRPDLYAILEIPPSATQAEISHAYRSLLRRHHPDTRQTGDNARATASDAALQQILAAYTVLRHPARRADYDREAKPRIHPAPAQSPQPPRHDRAYRQPPVVAGPVYWQSAPAPPAP